MPEFTSPADIGNLALQFCGQPPMSATLGFLDNNARARAVAAVYGKLRRAELRRTVFKFANKVTVLRAIDVTTMRIQPTLWSSSVTYFKGSIVADTNGTYWQSTQNSNSGSGNQPGVNFQAWMPYFGPQTCDVYSSQITYATGEMVYTTAGDGTYEVYYSLVNRNGLDPAMQGQWVSASMYAAGQVITRYPAWSSLTTYSQGQAVSYTDGNNYVSLVNSNLNVAPPSSGTNWALIPLINLITSIYPSTASTVPFSTTSPVIEWDIATVYSIGTIVTFSGLMYVSIANNNTGNNPATASSDWKQITNGVSYISLLNFNIGNDPLTAATFWSSSFTGGVGNLQWLQIGGSAFPNGVGLTPETPLYPVGAGPYSQANTRNVFRLPSGFLREAPQDPKAGGMSWLGAPSGLYYKDWEYRGNYITTSQVDPIVLQFQADVQDVTQFDDMFCVGLAERIALTIAEQLTQSQAVVQMNAAMYREHMGEARIVSGVERGAEEPAVDDYIACRL